MSISKRCCSMLCYAMLCYAVLLAIFILYSCRFHSSTVWYVPFVCFCYIMMCYLMFLDVPSGSVLCCLRMFLFCLPLYGIMSCSVTVWYFLFCSALPCSVLTRVAAFEALWCILHAIVRCFAWWAMSLPMCFLPLSCMWCVAWSFAIPAAFNSRSVAQCHGWPHGFAACL